MKKRLSVLLAATLLLVVHTTANAAAMSAPATDAVNLFAYDIEWICTLDPDNDTYVGIKRWQSSGEWEKYIYSGYLLSMLNGMGELTPIRTGKHLEGDVLVKLFDGARYSYKLESGNVLNINGNRYAIGAEQAHRFNANLRSNIQNYHQSSTFPKWLVYMNAANVVAIEPYQPLQPNDPADYPKDDSGEDELEFMTCDLYERYFDIAEGARYEPSHTGLPDDAEYYALTVTFQSGVVYKIMAHGNTLCVESSDKSYGCQYTLKPKGEAKTVREAYDDWTVFNPPLL